ncbi:MULTISPECIES: IclR family transcriptional regulator [Rhodococcus]|uniref:IclR family transcriptional regulator n=1 Tax=Rhodococcus TaxID=1827 RepID=UPI00077B1830|nr:MULTISPECIES: IclR family transcriptional regulator [Rhodococcus]KXX55416.1 IclR family transcriptional regulator [Rhodococcus sp. LB1]MDV7089325.1 IclR family transcriptional regulator [Rhodococcus opacus]
MPDSGGDSVIGRVVRLLSAFDRNLRSLPLTTLANRADLPLTTTHRLVNELVKHGLLERAPSKEISIGLRLWEISARGSHTMTLREAALPFMEDLQTILRQHVSLAVLDAGSVLFLERLASPDSTLDAGRMAERYPLHGCSTGLVLLAFSSPDYQGKVLSGPLDKLTDRTVTDPVLLRRILAEVRQQRFSYAAGFGIERWSGLAVPIIGEHGAVIAALNVAYPRGEENVLTAIPAMQTVATSIARAVAGTPVARDGNRSS